MSEVASELVEADRQIRELASSNNIGSDNNAELDRLLSITLQNLLAICEFEKIPALKEQFETQFPEASAIVARARENVKSVFGDNTIDIDLC